MRKDHRPYWVKKAYLTFRAFYAKRFLAPHCDFLGDHGTYMKPWYTDISGPNIRIGHCVTLISEKYAPVKIGVWGHEPDSGEIHIGDYVLISPGCRISACDQIHIGNSVMMANGVYITDSDWHGIYNRVDRPKEKRPVIIGDNVWLGDGCTILKGVTIGENSIVAANAVVTKAVPQNVIVAGNPAKVVKALDPDESFTTRADFFSDPIALSRFYEGIDKMVLKGNGFWHWLRTLWFPVQGD
ncbi:MAG: acyltransferase [Cellvibrionales bacterium]|nr:acyltransferase [Cellvibrionales bacterium]